MRGFRRPVNPWLHLWGFCSLVGGSGKQLPVVSQATERRAVPVVFAAVQAQECFYRKLVYFFSLGIMH